MVGALGQAHTSDRLSSPLDFTAGIGKPEIVGNDHEKFGRDVIALSSLASKCGQRKYQRIIDTSRRRWFGPLTP
jgi:hypothetical protein